MKKPEKIFCSFCGAGSHETLVIPGPRAANICVDCAKQIDLVSPGDIVVITSGIPVTISGTTNILKVDTVK